MYAIGVVALFPEIIEPVAATGVVGRAVKRELLGIRFSSPRDFATDRHRTVDDRPYGGGPGMVMQYLPVRDAVEALEKNLPAGSKRIVMSAQGRLLDQDLARSLAAESGLVVIAGRYEGLDERVTLGLEAEEVSIGDYVLSGGELAAAVLIDAVARLLPGVLGHEASPEQDSFVAGLLDCPHYTRPETVDGMAVPPVLLSGDHEAIRRWRLKQALGRTWQRRPDLLAGRVLGAEERELLEEFKAELGSAVADR
jgi:tRNA (guanine37-N1)-methyltransferase